MQKTGYSFTKYGHWKNGAQDKIKDLSIFTTTKEIILNVTLVRSREAQHLIKEKVSLFSFYEAYTYAFHFYSVVLKPIYRWTKLNFPGELLNFLEAGKFFGLERLH